jgi:hypothetical protein
MPSDLTFAPTDGTYPVYNPSSKSPTLGPGVNPTGLLSGLMITGDYTLENQQNILVNLGILLDGQYRENLQPAGVFNYVEKYTRTSGYAPPGLYCYNFCLHTSPYDLQPSGALNMNRFVNIQMEFTTIVPPLDPLAQVLTICDPETGDIIGINKSTWRIYDYNFNFILFEERVNVVTFVGGNCGLMYAT